MHMLQLASLLGGMAATTFAAPSSLPPLPGNLTFYSPSWPEWNNYVSRWSIFSAPSFSYLFLPETADQLSQGLAYLSRNHLPYLAKGGGHGYSATLGVDQNVVQVNMNNFKYVNVNPDMTATVGGAATMLDVNTALYSAGRELTVGTFPCVGATGALLGGGLGRLEGLYGVMSDSLQRVKIALWNGTIVEASKTVNSDLFWGVQGAGHNFGIVIESTVQTYPDQGGKHYYVDMTFTDSSLEGVLTTYQQLLSDGLPAPAAMALGYVFNVTSMSPLITLNLVYAHDEQKGRALASKFASTGPKAKYPITRVSFTESFVTFADLPLQGAAMATCEKGHNQDVYPAMAAHFFDIPTMMNLYKSFGSFVRANPVANGSLILFEYAGHSVTNSLPDDHSAFPLRNKYTLSSIISMAWDGNNDTKVIDAWAANARRTLAQPKVSGSDKVYVYENYAHGDESLSAIFGYEAWRHKRLTGLKAKYDPHGFFNAYHAIPLDLKKWT
ncbi:hypothetical protein GGR51DRAFT_576935 [Nemania sp. FL0031]|nr:hypothetical protein GGR51DRAFT_576935 [Nemania sp. FL0031]